jgi:hypothetical protein
MRNETEAADAYHDSMHNAPEVDEQTDIGNLLDALMIMPVSVHAVLWESDVPGAARDVVAWGDRNRGWAEVRSSSGDVNALRVRRKSDHAELLVVYLSQRVR